MRIKLSVLVLLSDSGGVKIHIPVEGEERVWGWTDLSDARLISETLITTLPIFLARAHIDQIRAELEVFGKLAAK